jgi:hypothetical protein
MYPMRRPALRLTCLLLFAALTACAAATSGIESPGVFRKNIGLATSLDFMDIGKSIFQRYQYVVLREEPPPQLLLESDWRDRAAFSDEAPGGALARTRVILVGRPSSRSTSGAGPLYDVSVTVESQLRGFDGDWQPATMTPLLTEYVQDMVVYIESNFRSTVRRFGVPPSPTP